MDRLKALHRRAKRLRRILDEDPTSDTPEPSAKAHIADLELEAVCKEIVLLEADLPDEPDPRTVPPPPHGPRRPRARKHTGVVAALVALPIKVCSCGKVYSQKMWDELPSLGTSEYPWGEIQDFKNCECGTTMTLTIVEGEPEDLPAAAL